ncbi:MAG: alpha/beta hydrolase [Ruminiclostridium sp.]|nr:alpha/beta hydrolase [Ruminiclostridium sp.]
MVKEFVTDKIYCKKWIPEKPRAVIQVIHGLGEMTEYYEQFAEFMMSQDIGVFMGELRYHGRTTLPVDEDDIITLMCEESYKLCLEMKKELSGIPYILLGHSMGATIAQLMLRDYNLYDKAILTGCANIEKLDELLPCLDREIEKNGIDNPCLEVFMKVFGKVAERFPEKCTISWVTSDLERAEFYEKLPYSNVMYSNRFYKSFLSAQKITQDKDFAKGVEKKIPLFILSGSEDSVGGYGLYPPRKAEEYKKAGFDVTLKIYEGMRHSILQEKDRKSVYLDILNAVGDR